MAVLDNIRLAFGSETAELVGTSRCVSGQRSDAFSLGYVTGGQSKSCLESLGLVVVNCFANVEMIYSA